MRLRHALRRLAQSPGFTLTAVVSLAVGIGANCAIFSLVNAILLREPPLERPEELVEIYIDDENFPYRIFSYPDYEELRARSAGVFSGVSASQFALAQVDREGGIDVLPAELVSGNYFPLLGVDPHLGRSLLPEDDVAPGAHPVVVLGYGYWQRVWGGDPDVVGKELRLSGRLYTVVGIAPRDYPGTFPGLVPDLFLPIQMLNQIQPSTVDLLDQRRNHSVFVKGRLLPEVSLEEAQVAVEGISRSLHEDFPSDWTREDSIFLLPTEEVILYPPLDRFVRAAAWLLMTVVGLVLLLACANLASFLLARGTDRRRELAVKMALGATRRSLILDLLAETTLLSLIGGLAGLGLALAFLRLLVRADLPLPMPISLDLRLDLVVLAFSLLVSLVAGLLFGLAPALQATRGEVAPALRQETAGAGGAGRVGLRNGLVVVQVALALVLSVGAGLFLRSFQATRAVDPGFGYEPAAILTVGAPSDKYDTERGLLFYRGLVERIEKLPGVQSAGLVENLHLNTLSTNTFRVLVDGVEPPPGQDYHTVDSTTANPGFFDAVGIRILRGRSFTPEDDQDAPLVAIVSRAMAERFWPGESALGQTVRTPDGATFEVVGVAADTKVRTLGEAPRPFLYRSFAQSYDAIMTVVARTTGNPRRTALEMLETARQLEPELWTWEAKTMERHLGIMLLPSRLSALLLSTFAGLALGLASIGLYGLISYTVARRSREVGIRMALGARRGTLVSMLVLGGMKLVGAGAAVGLVLSLVLSRALGGLLFGVEPFDPLSFLGAPSILFLVALLAVLIPARSASRVDPVRALRAE